MPRQRETPRNASSSSAFGQSASPFQTPRLKRVAAVAPAAVAPAAVAAAAKPQAEKKEEEKKKEMKNATWTGYGVNKRGKPTKSFYQQAKEDWLRLRKEESSARLAYAEQARKTGSPESAKNYANQFPYSEEDYLKSHELAVKQLLQSIRRHEYAAQKATVDVNNLTAVIRTGEKANADEDQKEEAENAKAELLISEQLVKDNTLEFNKLLGDLNNLRTTDALKIAIVKEFLDQRKVSNADRIAHSAELERQAALVKRRKEAAEQIWKDALKAWLKSKVDFSLNQPTKDRLASEFHTAAGNFRKASNLEFEYTRRADLSALPVELSQSRINAAAASEAEFNAGILERKAASNEAVEISSAAATERYPLEAQLLKNKGIPFPTKAQIERVAKAASENRNGVANAIVADALDDEKEEEEEEDHENISAPLGSLPAGGRRRTHRRAHRSHRSRKHRKHSKHHTHGKHCKHSTRTHRNRTHRRRR